MKLQVLGCAGGIGGRERQTTCLRVDDDILLDAGTGLTSLDIDQLTQIDHVFLTHAHLDHVAGLAFLLDAVQGRRAGAVTVHASDRVISALRTHLFNWVLWPDFAKIPDESHPVLRWQPVAPGESVTLGARRIAAHEVNHTLGSNAYAVCAGPSGFLFTGDMGPTPSLWEALRRDTALRSVIVDCSFADADHELARLSRHFCPRSLLADIGGVDPAVELLIYHLKPGQEALIMRELREAAGARTVRALKQFDLLEF